MQSKNGKFVSARRRQIGTWDSFHNLLQNSVSVLNPGSKVCTEGALTEKRQFYSQTLCLDFLRIHGQYTQTELYCTIVPGCLRQLRALVLLGQGT